MQRGKESTDEIQSRLSHIHTIEGSDSHTLLHTTTTWADVKTPHAWVVPRANEIRRSEGGRLACSLLKLPGEPQS